MYAALFEVKSWMGTDQYVFEGENACELLAQFEKVQDLFCIVEMGREYEGPAGQEAINKLESILDLHYSKKLTVDDLKELNVSISIGCFWCVKVVEGDEAINTLKAEAK